MKEVVLDKDYNKIQSNLKKNLKYFLGSSIGGIALNRMLTKSNFYPNYFLIRFPLRLALFFAPNSIFY
jgi:hypothetical protein